jgi:hypothetical protein
MFHRSLVEVLFEVCEMEQQRNELWSAKTQEGIFQINVTLLHPEDLEAGAPWDYVNGWEGCTMRVRYLRANARSFGLA